MERLIAFVKSVRFWLILSAMLIVVLSALGLKSKLFEELWRKAETEKVSAQEQDEMKGGLIDELDQFHEKGVTRRRVESDAIAEVIDAGAEKLGEDNSLLARMRRSDAAWRRGLERLHDGDRVGNTGERDAEGVHGSPSDPAQ